MSILYIREYGDSGNYTSGQSIPMEPANTDQHVTFTGTAGQSAAFQNNTRCVRITVDGVANILFGTNPTAVAGQNLRLSAGQVLDFQIPFSSGLKVSAITAPA
jgi:hypothetical protein